MRKWGFLISGFYVLILFLVLDPLATVLFEESNLPEVFEALKDYPWVTWWVSEGEFWWMMALWALVLITGQALLLFVSVDTSFKRVQPRRHIAVSIATVALMLGMLSSMLIWSLLVGFKGDDVLGGDEDDLAYAYWLLVAVFWIVWGVIFYLYKADASEKLNKMIGWLIKGSILELLIVVPCHVVVRHREDCSAPMVTGYGIATGLAVMLLAFGPSVLFLYQKRLERYKRKGDSAKPVE